MRKSDKILTSLKFRFVCPFSLFECGHCQFGFRLPHSRQTHGREWFTAENGKYALYLSHASNSDGSAQFYFLQRRVRTKDDRFLVELCDVSQTSVKCHSDSTTSTTTHKNSIPLDHWTIG